MNYEYDFARQQRCENSRFRSNTEETTIPIDIEDNMEIKLNKEMEEELENSEEVFILSNQSIMFSITVFQNIKVIHACNRNANNTEMY